MLKANARRFNVTYSRIEAPVLVPIEYTMMKELGMDRSSLHKADQGDVESPSEVNLELYLIEAHEKCQSK